MLPFVIGQGLSKGDEFDLHENKPVRGPGDAFSYDWFRA